MGKLMQERERLIQDSVEWIVRGWEGNPDLTDGRIWDVIDAQGRRHEGPGYKSSGNAYYYRITPWKTAAWNLIGEIRWRVSMRVGRKYHY